MSLVTVDGSKVGLSKELKIKKTFKNTKLCMKAQLEFAQVVKVVNRFDVKKDDTLVDSLKSQLDLFESYTKFLKDILGLTNKQIEALDDADTDDITDLVTAICSSLMGEASDKNKSKK